MNATQSHITPEYLASQGLSPTFPERFFSKIKFTDSCWLWQAYKMPSGYGQIGRGRPRHMILAHRASWLLHFGPIPKGFRVLHDCPDGDNPSCVNPAHLWLGTDMDNVTDCRRKGRFNRAPIWKISGEMAHQAKLDWKKVSEIREVYSPYRVSIKSLAKRYGVSMPAISAVLKNKTWVNPAYESKYPRFTSKLSDEQCQAIKQAYCPTVSQEVLAKRYGVSSSLISTVLRRVLHSTA